MTTAKWLEEDGGLDALELTAGSSLVNPMYLFRGDAPVKEFAGAFKPPLRWGIRMTGKKFLREYPYREAYLLRDAKKFRAEIKMPLILLGGITNRETMDLAMAEGFDFVAMGRALLAEPDLINRIEADGDAHGAFGVHALQPVHGHHLQPHPLRGHRVAGLAASPIELVPMSRPAPPALTVRYDGSARTFAAGNDVVIGRDLRADVRIAHPLISRAHLVLRFDQGRWVAIDNGSLNGMYVNGRRVPTVDIQDGQRLNIGNPDGPQLTFEVGRQPTGSAGRPPQTASVPVCSGPARPAVHPATADVAPAAQVPIRSRAEVPVRATAAAPDGRPAPGSPARDGAADLPPVDRTGHGDGPDGRAALQRDVESRDQHAQDPAAGQARRGAARARSRSAAPPTTTS